MAGTSGAGRRRIQTRRTPRSDAQEPSFSKRCSVLFKEASELSTLCAVETALVIFSPDGKAFSFGHPSVEAVLSRLANSGMPDSDSSQHAQHNDEATLERLYKRNADLLEELGAVRKQNGRLEQMLMEHQRKMELSAKPLDELSVEDLETLKSMSDEFLKNLAEHNRELLVGPAAGAASSAGETDASVSRPEGESSADARGHNIGRQE